MKRTGMKWKGYQYVTILAFTVISIIGEAQRIPSKLPQNRDTSKVTQTGTVRRDSLGRTVGSRILDDTTKNIYGPHTTRWISEDDLFYNRKNYRYLDTLINNFHRWTYVQRFENFYHDLGNMGTALNPLFPKGESTIGARSGFYVYDPYYETEEPKYFNTLSPYTRMYIVWGGSGRAITGAEFSRNITPTWNFGINFRPILVDRQIQRVGKGNPRQTISHYYDAYTSYQTPNQKYLVLLSFRRIKHQVLESGGAIKDSTSNRFDPNAQLNLTEAKSIELRRNFHLFQQFSMNKSLQPYITTDYTLRQNEFYDLTSSEDSNYFDYVEIAGDTANDISNFDVFKNELGVKGSMDRIFYNGYVKFRNYNFSNSHLDTIALPFDRKATEVYVGGRLSYMLDSVTFFTFQGETYNEYYQVSGDFRYKYFNINVSALNTQPSLIHMAYRGAHDFWVNDFNSVKEINGYAYLKGEFGAFMLYPGLRMRSLNDYIYFKEFATTGQKVLPTQSNGSQSILSPELRFSYRAGPMVIRPHIIYTAFLKNDDDAIRTPTWFINAQLAFERGLFKGALEAQIGFDFHWKSSYYGMGYDPMTQQYYVQDNSQVNSYLLADFFLNGKLKRGRFFIKYHNILQLITKDMYYTTPLYSGQKNILDFGFDILLFD
ncbi:MAG: putative porin [Flammeovirgaceae bacterium]|nr:putative porin [Flammeovirgaceae bacterium]